MEYLNTSLKELFPEEGWYSFMWSHRSTYLIYGKVDLVNSTSTHINTSEGVWGNTYRENDTYSIDSLRNVSKVDVSHEEIQKHLPSNHPCKIVIPSYYEFKVGVWYRNNWNNHFYLLDAIDNGRFMYSKYIRNNNDNGVLKDSASTRGRLLTEFSVDKIADYSIILPLLIGAPKTVIYPSTNAPFPTTWCIKVGDAKNHPEICTWIYNSHKGYPSWSRPGYITSSKRWTKDCAFTEISEEAFIKGIYAPYMKKIFGIDVPDIVTDPMAYVNSLCTTGSGSDSDCTFSEQSDDIEDIGDPVKKASTHVVELINNISVAKEKVNNTIFVAPMNNITI